MAASGSEEGVLVVGSCNADLCAYTPRFPAPGETIMGTDFKQGCGGKGANQAVMAAKLGLAPVRFLGCVGDDAQGKMMREGMSSAGVDTEALATAEDDTPSGVAAILIDSSGENCVVVVPGANAKVTPSFVAVHGPRVDAATVVVTQNEIPPEGTKAVLARAAAAAAASPRGLPLTVSNPAPVPAEAWAELLECVDVLVLNETEAAALGGSASDSSGGDSARAAKAAAAGLRPAHASRPRVLVVTLGARGAVVAVVPAGGGDATTRLVEAPASDGAVVDTVGAGDAFVGTLSAVLASAADPASIVASADSMSECVRKACCVAGMTVRAKGTQTSYPGRDEVAALHPAVLEPVV